MNEKLKGLKSFIRQPAALSLAACMVTQARAAGQTRRSERSVEVAGWAGWGLCR